MFRKDRIKKVYSKLKKIKITQNIGRCDDPESSSYNRLIKFPFEKTKEWADMGIHELLGIILITYSYN